jgi:acid phosphatase type 7
VPCPISGTSVIAPERVGFRQGYYSYNLGNWHVIALNSPLYATGGVDQLMWLKDDLESAKGRCTLAYWHYPVFTSGPSNG